LRKGYQELVPLEDINTAIENAGKLEIYKLEKNAGYHFRSRTYDWFFRDSGNDSGFHKMATAGGQIEVGALSEGIYTAMTTTVWWSLEL
jgi:biopolymer transport protein ExbB